MKDILNWEFPNQFEQSGAIPSPPLRAQLLLRNYYLCAKSAMKEMLSPAFVPRLLQHVMKSLPFDNEGLESFEKLGEKKGVKIFTYGSLLHPTSANFNLKGKGRAVFAFGLKRIFNYGKSDIEGNHLGLPSPEFPLETARLNVKATGELANLLPGAVYEVDHEDLLSLAEREKGYSLKKVQVVDYVQAVYGKLPKVEEAYVLILPEGDEQKNAFPHQSYLNVCLEGAKRFGTRFLKLFALTTYLADGETTILEWLRNEVITMNLELIPAIN